MKCYDINQLRHKIGLPDWVKGEITDIKYSVHQKGDRYCLLTDKKYSLFFLIEGSIRIYPAPGEKIINKGYFFTIAYPTVFSYTVEEDARCVILSFNDLKHPGNVDFFKKSDLMKVYPQQTIFSLPIKEPLQHIIDTLWIYINGGSDYPNIHEVVFVLIRALYLPSDVAAVFQRIGVKNRYFSQRLHV